MTESEPKPKPNDRWSAGDAYELYMGRWSRQLARVFLDWLRPEPAGHWLEVGCGTGALTSAIMAVGRPESVLACDPSSSFIDHARAHVAGACTFEVLPVAGQLPARPGGFDVIVSGLVLNFMAEPTSALRGMSERARPGGVVSAYVWDYVQGLEFVRYFWEQAAQLDAAAASLDERRRFESWQTPQLESLFGAAGLTKVQTGVLEVSTNFADFDDFWRPFLGGSGPAPAYVATLASDQRERLRAALERRLPRGADGRIRLQARAVVARGERG
jgi:SAM-dependent methyltransferase